MRGGRPLTPRERQVADLVSHGRTNPQIAQSLGVSPSSVKSTLANIMRKWHCSNRTQVAVEVVRRRGIEEDNGPDAVA